MRTKLFFLFLGAIGFWLCFLNLAWLKAQIEDRNNDPSDRHLIHAILKSGGSSLIPKFDSGTRIKTGDNLMKVDTYTSVPCIVDWNGDKKKDLLVGCFYDGFVYLYLNSGTNNAPVFSTGTKLQADGKDISVTYG